jgi:hypothetical protein
MQKSAVGRQCSKWMAMALASALLLDGLTSGKEIALTPEFWQELRGEAAQILAKRKAAQKKRATK